MRSEFLVDIFVVAVEPGDLFGRELIKDDGLGVDGTQGERLKLEEGAEVRGLVRTDGQRILAAHLPAR